MLNEALSLDELNIDEMVWQVRESDHVLKDVVGIHRVQRVWVVRGDELLEFQKDLGPIANYPLATPFIFFAGNEYSVGEALEQAEYLREMQPRPEEPSDLIGDWFKQLDELKQLKKKRSVIGPMSRVQRN